VIGAFRNDKLIGWVVIFHLSHHVLHHVHLHCEQVCCCRVKTALVAKQLNVVHVANGTKNLTSGPPGLAKKFNPKPRKARAFSSRD
jgi:hypothetical protein